MNLLLKKTLGIEPFRKGANVNQTPFKSDLLYELGDSIVANAFVDKISGKSFPITGYDFPVGWTKGFPYKSAATVSAPADYAALVAVDNGFWYTAGVPNQIPVVSLFQNIDYDGRYFNLHSAQTVDLNGVETYEPRVSKMTGYNRVMSGADLVKCQSYNNVPVEATSNVKWVDFVNGVDTNAGTKALPWKTFAKIAAAVATGYTVYVKSAVYTDTSLYWGVAKTVLVKSIGRVVLRTGGTNYVLAPGATGTTFEGIILDGENLVDKVLYTVGGNVVFNKCVIKNELNKLSDENATGTKHQYINCVFAGRYANTALSLNIKSSTFNTCYFKDVYTYINSYNTDIVTITNSKFNETNPSKQNINAVTELLMTGCNVYHAQAGVGFSGSLTVLYCNFYPIAVTASSAITTGAAVLGKLTVKYNKFESLYDTISQVSYFINATNLKSWDIQYNIFRSKVITDFTHIYIKNTTVISGRTGSINYNRCEHNTPLGAIITTNNEDTASNVNDGVEFIGNTIIGSRKLRPDLSTSCHSIFVNGGKNCIISRNKITYSGMGIVVKNGATGTAYTTGGVYDNVIKECNYGITIGGNGVGLSGLLIANNTIQSSVQNGSYLGFGISCLQGASSIICKNNITKSSLATYTDYSFDSTTSGCVAKNGTLSGSTLLSDAIANYASLATAQAAGKLLNCIVSDPLLDANLIPASSILIGENLGVNYKDALDIATTWGSETTSPVIVINELPETGLVPVGAYNTLP